MFMYNKKIAQINSKMKRRKYIYNVNQYTSWILQLLSIEKLPRD